jgi:hypothetical protein
MSREGIGSLPGEKQEPESGTRTPPRPRLFQPGSIKRLFGSVKKAITRQGQPAPEPNRKRREETGRAFRMTARELVRRAVRMPAEAYARATAYLADTLDWLNFWHHHEEHSTEDVQPATNDHLYPHL